jgi:hypothetical protein
MDHHFRTAEHVTTLLNTWNTSTGKRIMIESFILCWDNTIYVTKIVKLG